MALQIISMMLRQLIKTLLTKLPCRVVQFHGIADFLYDFTAVNHKTLLHLPKEQIKLPLSYPISLAPVLAAI